MSLFQCDKCGVIENTSLTWYHGRGQGMLALCSACHPEICKWHERFPRRLFPIGTMETDREGNIREKVKP